MLPVTLMPSRVLANTSFSFTVLLAPVTLMPLPLLPRPFSPTLFASIVFELPATSMPSPLFDVMRFDSSMLQLPMTWMPSPELVPMLLAPRTSLPSPSILMPMTRVGNRGGARAVARAVLVGPDRLQERRGAVRAGLRGLDQESDRALQDARGPRSGCPSLRAAGVAVVARPPWTWTVMTGLGRDRSR